MSRIWARGGATAGSPRHWIRARPPFSGPASGLSSKVSRRFCLASTTRNEAYLTWAGITAGKAASFYSFTGGGDNWASFFSPDQKGFNEPIQIAYTASFGGGFSATIAAQSPG